METGIDRRLKKSVLFATRLRQRRAEVEKLREKNEMLERIAYYDGLTGLYTRHSFMPLFEEELRIAYEEEISLSFLMMDLDKFKLFNDAYGHPTGDILIKLAANAIVTAVRQETDIAVRIDEENQKDNGQAGRMGGEELAVILGGADKDVALIVGKRIQERYLMLQNEAKENGILTKDTPPQTMSIGIATVNGGEDNKVTTDDLYKKADQALYEAKKERNKIKFFTT